MVNIDDFVKRLELVLDYYGLNASAFADRIGVQRSSMSHLLSGRNKPSLDFVMKILEVFPDVNLYWMLTGKGNFPEHNTKHSKITISTPLPEEHSEIQFSVSEVDEKRKNNLPSDLENQSINLKDEEIEKIVLFYKNGTFKAYLP